MDPKEKRTVAPPHASNIVFSEFEIDPAARELRKSGIRIPLQDQPFRILTILLQRPGELVTREELRDQLWPADTFIEFEHSLNTSINKLRRALSDSAETPRFIETVPRRGYRFIGALAAPRPIVAQRRIWPAIAALCLAMLTAGVWQWARRLPAEPLTATPLTTYPGFERKPSLSPDGSQVAFTWDGPEENNTDIYVKVVGPGEPLRLTTDPAVDDTPVWSPDGRWIAFVRRHATAPRGDVLIVPALGGAERKIGLTVFSDLTIGPTLAWTRDNKWLAIRDDSGSGRSPGLYLLSIDTGESKLLLPSPAVKEAPEAYASFSPDEKKLAFSRDHKLYVVDIEERAAKGEPRRLTNDPATIDGSPVWTPDPGDIVFRSLKGVSAATLRRVPADGSGPAIPIPGIGSSAFEPAIGRQGGRLVFSERFHDSNIWRMPLRAGGTAAGPPVRVIASSRIDSAGAFSPNGKRVAFFSNRSGTDQLWAAGSDGANPVQLTHFSGGLVGTPKWSPDGKWIAYDAYAGGNRDIYVMAAEGGPGRRLTQNAADDRMPAWSADGKWVYFSSDRGGPREIWRKPSGGGEEVQVTRNGGYNARESPDGKYFCYITRAAEGLWMMPIKAGVPDEANKKLVANRANFLVFDVSNSGIYFDGVTGPANGTLRFYDFATGCITIVVETGKPLSFGLSVSSDERWLLFAQVDRSGADLMLIEGFR
ncbi:MAG TPA: winged helix-turn-helix domain-containing protein [Bryobacteraceae bacterium]|nr:winged helix-turn-helix domain-containing protein [Bryobacteraceae bacterium]